MAEEKRRQKRWKIILTVVTLLALLGLIYAVRNEIFETFANLGRVNGYILLLMIPAQILNYHAYSKMYQHLFKILGNKFSYKRLLRITTELNFVNNVFPSGGVSGFSYFGIRMKAERVSAGRATLVQVMRFILLFISFQALIIFGLFVLALEGGVNNLVILIAGSLATLTIVGTFILAFIIGSKRRINNFFTYITKVFNRLIYTLRPKHPETIDIARVQRIFTDLHENYRVFRKKPQVLKMPLFYALLANIGEVLTIYVVYLAFGEFVNIGAIILAYAIANFAGFVSVLPGGVGIYEGLMTAVLVATGVPVGISISATVMYRVLNIGLQLPPGYFFYNKAIKDFKFKTPS